MNIILLSGSNSRSSGGLYNSVRRLAQTLDEIPNTSANILAHNDRYSSEDIEAYFPLQPVAYSVNGPFNFGYSPDLPQILSKLLPDIVHLQCVWMYLSYANLRFHHRTQTPYLISPRGMLDPWALGFSSWKKKLVGKLFENEHLRKAACLHALGFPEYQAIRQYGLKNPVAVIPNAIDLPKANPATLVNPWPLTNGRKVLLFLGRIHPKKGIGPLLQALRQSQSFRKDWFLVVAGESQDTKYTTQLQEQIVSLGLSADAQLIGPQFHVQKDTCFRLADAFILPSFSEGLPMAVLEAWSYRLPVMMTVACNLPEGFAYQAAIEIKTDPIQLADQLQQFALLSEAERQQMGANGYDLVKEKFTWEQVAIKMHSVYNWVLGGGQRPDCVELK